MDANSSEPVCRETAVPDGESPVTCPYCERPFPDERLRTLHLGFDHHDRLDDGEREAFEAAYLEESAEIRRIRWQLVAVLIAVYFGLLFVYAFVA